MRTDTITMILAATLAATTPTRAADPDASRPVQDRSILELHDAVGVPGSTQRAATIEDLQSRILSGEIPPFAALLTSALSERIVAGLPETDLNSPLSGMLTTGEGNARGFGVYDDDFSGYPLSDDPIFDRFQVGIQNKPNTAGLPWTDSQAWFIPSLFDAAQSDPLPSWQGVVMTEDPGLPILAGDFNSDGVVDTADLGSLISVFGQTGPPRTPRVYPRRHEL